MKPQFLSVRAHFRGLRAPGGSGHLLDGTGHSVLDVPTLGNMPWDPVQRCLAEPLEGGTPALGKSGIGGERAGGLGCLEVRVCSPLGQPDSARVSHSLTPTALLQKPSLTQGYHLRTLRQACSPANLHS